MKSIKKLSLKIIVINTFLVLYCNNLFAASDQIPLERYITKVQAYEDYALITFEPPFANTQGCQTSATVSDKFIINLTTGMDANKGSKVDPRVKTKTHRV
ncbi:MAG: hypothetical protein ABW168_29360 [Sedimenticola sp.]